MGKSIGEKIYGEKDENDTLTISYMMGAESRNEVIRALHKRIEELEAQKDGAYSERNKMLVGMCSMAIALGYGVYVMPHVGEEWDDDWRNIVVIEGPTGQMSWHVHDSEMELFKGLPHVSENRWDGHDTEEKYERVIGLSECVPAMKTHRLNDASKRIEELEAVVDDVLHELNVCSPLGDVHWVQLQERMEQAVGEKGNRP